MTIGSPPDVSRRRDSAGRPAAPIRRRHCCHATYAMLRCGTGAAGGHLPRRQPRGRQGRVTPTEAHQPAGWEAGPRRSCPGWPPRRALPRQARARRECEALRDGRRKATVPAPRLRHPRPLAEPLAALRLSHRASRRRQAPARVRIRGLRQRPDRLVAAPRGVPGGSPAIIVARRTCTRRPPVADDRIVVTPACVAMLPTIGTGGQRAREGPP